MLVVGGGLWGWGEVGGGHGEFEAGWPGDLFFERVLRGGGRAGEVGIGGVERLSDVWLCGHCLSFCKVDVGRALCGVLARYAWDGSEQWKRLTSMGSSTSIVVFED